MQGFRAKCRVALLITLTLCIGLTGLYGLLKPVANECVMTYMYPTYIPISTPPPKYNLYKYHEGWRKIDFNEHIKKLTGVPLLFIPAESDRAYQGGPLERTYYYGAGDIPNQYSHRLDWFAVDLEEEHSAMDGQIVEEHTEYVVYAIHRILDLYKESHDMRSKEGAEPFGSLPRSVVLVGHSMGGFVARAAIVHPHLRKGVVETVLTLSSPHQSPPVALQPSLGHYYHLVNQKWRKGYEVELTHIGRQVSEPTLSHVIVVSISGNILDYQVRSKLETLDGIVPSSHRFMIGTTGMRNAWLSTEHQTILWCNQVVVQISHTLLSLIDPKIGQPFPSTQKRLTVFTKMLRSEMPPSFNWMREVKSSIGSIQIPLEDGKSATGTYTHNFSPCPQSVHWNDDGLERDLYIQGPTVTVLAMDGRRRWLDILKLGSDGKNYFAFVTNLAPCSGVRLHLWPEKSKMASDTSPSKGVVEVTSKMVEIPAGPAPIQIEPGSQTEQPPPSAVLQLGPEDMRGFRFLTISVAPRPTVSGRPPPAASMAVGQFFNPDDGKRKFSPASLLLSFYSEKEISLKEDHPLVFNLSFSISLGLLPVAMSLKTTGCGIKSSELPVEEAGDVEHSRLCRLRCFPPVAIAWDSTSGLHVIPNLYSETISVDSSPAFWDSTQESDMTTVLLLSDPHCSFTIGAGVSVTTAAGRFLLLYCSEIVGFSIAVIFFALMRQARAWELDLPLPSLLAAVELNLRMPLAFLLLAIVPIVVSLVSSLLISESFPPLSSFFIVSIICYAFANGSLIILILTSQLIIYFTANVHAFIKIRWQVWEENIQSTFFSQFLNLFSNFFSLKVLRIIRGNLTVAIALVSVILVCFVHPALGLLILLLSHALHSHTALCSHARKREFDSKTKVDLGKSNFKPNSGFDPLLPLEEKSPNSPNSTRSYGDTQIETFNHRHGLLMLHLLAVLMFVPSFVAWFQDIAPFQEMSKYVTFVNGNRVFASSRWTSGGGLYGPCLDHSSTMSKGKRSCVLSMPIDVHMLGCGGKLRTMLPIRIGVGQSFPWFLDSALCVGVILHGLCGSKPEYNFISFPFLHIQGQQVGLSIVYMFAGFSCYLSGLALAPYRAFYAMAAVGVISAVLRILEKSYRDKGEAYFSGGRKHFHRH
ncbi:hypothetical protein IFM89_001534 [Coptis chinensis]|uniref:GPI inositol-deacylase n=1 Tax=Coptis chinensis TaxID=261450 RepID=A0A835I2E6_9MAGN|nr:hypothetical protein IFM89_001534 [Coptis chinensis]